MKESRREINRRRNIDDILNAAEKLVGEKGVEEISVDDIANEAQFGKGTLYNYFKSKDEIILSLIERVFKQLREAVEDIDNQLQIKEWIRQYLAILSSMVVTKGMLSDNLLQYLEQLAWHAHSDKCSCEAAPFLETFHQPLEEAFQRAMDRNEIKKREPEMLTYALMGMLQSYKKLTLTHEGPLDLDYYLGEVLDIFFEKL